MSISVTDRVRPQIDCVPGSQMKKLEGKGDYFPNFPDKCVHFQGKYPIFTKIVVDGSMDRTTSEESWLHQKDPNGVL